MFLISDTGCGIAEEETHKLFKPFGQTSSALSKKVRGTGLGLVLSRQLARLLGGDIVLKSSKLGVGSTFAVTIDAGIALARSQDSGTKSLTQGTPQKNTSERLDGVHVLVAEDTPDQALLIKFLLTDLGAKVEIADNGALAVERVLKNGFDVVLMDMQMPVLSGLEATKVLRREGVAKPIIALTAQALTSDRERALAITDCP